jgi:hypothetical protein
MAETREPDAFEEDDDCECCIECGDEFHYDDTGGYNPPCVCGLHCRSCHEAEAMRDRDDDDAPFDDTDEDSLTRSPEGQEL